MKTMNFCGAIAAPLLMFALTAPSFADDAAAPTMCKDGTTSQSTGRGVCSGHGGQQKAAKSTAGSAATPAPAAPAPAAAAGAAATCKDGTASTSSGRGACSGHGGVQKATKPKPDTSAGVTPAPATAPASAPAPTPPAAATTAPAGATATCKDGTYSKSKVHTGACSQHGGVATWATAAQ